MSVVEPSGKVFFDLLTRGNQQVYVVAYGRPVIPQLKLKRSQRKHQWGISFSREDMWPRRTCHSWSGGETRERKSFPISLSLLIQESNGNTLTSTEFINMTWYICRFGSSLEFSHFYDNPQILAKGEQVVQDLWLVDPWNWLRSTSYQVNAEVYTLREPMLKPLWTLWWALRTVDGPKHRTGTWK